MNNNNSNIVSERRQKGSDSEEFRKQNPKQCKDMEN